MRAEETATARDQRGTASTHLQGPALVLARTVWAAVFFTFILLFVGDVPRRFDFVTRLAQSQPSSLQLGLGADGLATFFVSFDLFCMLAFSAVAALIFWRRSDDWMAIYVSLALITYGTIGTFYWFTVGKLSIADNGFLVLMEAVGIGLSVNFYFIFPSGQFVPNWTRLLTVAYLIWSLTWFFYPPMNPAMWPLQFSIPAQAGYYLIGVLSQFYRYRRAPNSIHRQQTKWVVFGTAAIAFGITAVQVFRVAAASQLNSLANAQINWLSIPLIVAFQLFVPVTFALAILRYRLYEIDILLNRSLVYVPLTAIIAGMYAAAIAFSSKLLVASSAQGANASTAFATLIVVVAFSPIKDQLQNLVDRRFKQAPDPKAKLNVFIKQIRERISPVDAEQIIHRMLEEAIAAFGAQGGAALSEHEGRPEPFLTLGEWNGETSLSVSLQDRGKCFGSIALGVRRDGREYTEPDRQVLTKAAQEVAVAIEQDHGKRVAGTLSASPVIPT